MNLVNTATIQARRDPKRPPPSDSPALAALRREAKGKIFFSNTLRQRWEQIVSKGRS